MVLFFDHGVFTALSQMNVGKKGKKRGFKTKTKRESANYVDACC